MLPARQIQSVLVLAMDKSRSAGGSWSLQFIIANVKDSVRAEFDIMGRHWFGVGSGITVGTGVGGPGGTVVGCVGGADVG